MAVPSKRRNPLLADFFNRLKLMERRGSGMKKIINSYYQYNQLNSYRKPTFTSNATEFHVTLWNLNYEESNKIVHNVQFQNNKFVKEFVKEDSLFAKEFVKAGRCIYKLISLNPKINAAQMAESMNISTRQVQKYMKRLQDLKKIIRVGGRKFGEWKIIDEEYENFFDRI